MKLVIKKKWNVKFNMEYWYLHRYTIIDSIRLYMQLYTGITTKLHYYSHITY